MGVRQTSGGGGSGKFLKVQVNWHSGRAMSCSGAAVGDAMRRAWLCWWQIIGFDREEGIGL